MLRIAEFTQDTSLFSLQLWTPVATFLAYSLTGALFVPTALKIIINLTTFGSIIRKNPKTGDVACILSVFRNTYTYRLISESVKRIHVHIHMDSIQINTCFEKNKTKKTLICVHDFSSSFTI